MTQTGSRTGSRMRWRAGTEMNIAKESRIFHPCYIIESTRVEVSRCS